MRIKQLPIMFQHTRHPIIIGTDEMQDSPTRSGFPLAYKRPRLVGSSQCGTRSTLPNIEHPASNIEGRYHIRAYYIVVADTPMKACTYNLVLLLTDP
jgi:hypothetical protein